jgi:hypothetical protein
MSKCYSADEESFNIDDFSEVIDKLENNAIEGQSIVGMKYWEADAIPYTHVDVISSHSVYNLLEDLDCQMGDEIPEFDYLYTEASKEAREELLKLLLQWAEKHVDVSRYYKVRNVVQKTIEADDLESSDLIWVDELEDNLDSLTNYAKLGNNLLKEKI